jgi:hypothetical protein
VCEPVAGPGVLERRRLLGLQPAQILSGYTHDASHIGDRQREILVIHHHQQCLIDRERERQSYGEHATLPGPRRDIESAAELLDVRIDYIETHSTPGDLRHLLHGAESRLEDQLEEFLVGQLRAGGDHVLLHRHLVDGILIEAVAVVRDLDDDLGTRTGDRDAQRANLALARLLALLGRLDTVVHGVAQQMLQRRRDAFQDSPVESDVLAFDLQLHAFVELGHGAANEAPESLHLLREGQQARAHQSLLQILADPRLLREDVVGFARDTPEDLPDAAQIGNTLQQRSGELLQLRVAIELERVELALRIGIDGLVLAVLHLRFGFDLEATQLITEPGDGLIHLLEVVLEGADLLTEARL